MGTSGGQEVDDTEVLLMFDSLALRASAHGVTLQEMVRCDMSRLMQSLERVELRWMKLGNTIAKDLADLLRKCPLVASVDLADNFIGCMGCIQLSKAILHHQHLTALNLSGNRIADLGAAVLSSMIMTNTSLTSLDLSGNKLEKQAMQGIGGGLRGNTTLKMLLLSENFFADEGAVELGWALCYNHTLRTLSLCGNEITNAGANLLAAGLQKNSGLVDLDLSDNMISERGIINLTDSLYKNTTLAKMDLRSNQSLTKNSQDAILDALDFSHRWQDSSMVPWREQLPHFTWLEPPAKKKLDGVVFFVLCQGPGTKMYRDLCEAAALLSQARGGKKVSKNDKTNMMRAIRAIGEEVAPPLSVYEMHPVTQDSPIRIAISHAIHLKMRQILFEGQMPLQTSSA